ncbi:unnamed protein product [Phytophthora fragariaefolia]|uniref:Unnamed protein product n=1 Tax=Phytophthora fragariaefolia TaxID=1490495 RepID=A0A9W6Y3L9_9STRA|nr:unnamed protein product [Phytophthora fragariaefolia]
MHQTLEQDAKDEHISRQSAENILPIFIGVENRDMVTDCKKVLKGTNEVGTALRCLNPKNAKDDVEASTEMQRIQSSKNSSQLIRSQLQAQTQTLGMLSSPGNDASYNTRQKNTNCPAKISKPHHETCKVFGCLKWVKRHGNTSEYCPQHRQPVESQNDPIAFKATAAENVNPARVNTTTERRALCRHGVRALQK